MKDSTIEVTGGCLALSLLLFGWFLSWVLPIIIILLLAKWILL